MDNLLTIVQGNWRGDSHHPYTGLELQRSFGLFHSSLCRSNTDSYTCHSSVGYQRNIIQSYVI